MLGFGAGRRHTITVDPVVEVGAVVFHAPSKLQESGANAAVPPLRPLSFRGNQIEFIIRVIVEAIFFKYMQ
ncbi:hypothetical protein [Paracoccus jeotgali]|uniref:hypothetical protein n=1 Tax=Paracoccus jeotgali TaxID=2065379 RepID=UPI00131583AE|nr:hypothetical protein [Paracoccus jeotgali]